MWRGRPRTRDPSCHPSRLLVASCHPEPPSFGGRGIWASRAKPRVLCEAIIARLARIPIFPTAWILICHSGLHSNPCHSDTALSPLSFRGAQRRVIWVCTAPPAPPFAVFEGWESTHSTKVAGQNPARRGINSPTLRGVTAQAVTPFFGLPDAGGSIYPTCRQPRSVGRPAGETPQGTGRVSLGLNACEHLRSVRCRWLQQRLRGEQGSELSLSELVSWFC